MSEMTPFWSDVFRNFRQRNRGTDPERLPSGVWLQLAIDAEEDGSAQQAEIYFEASSVAAAYEVNIYNPPDELIMRYCGQRPLESRRQAGAPTSWEE